MKSILFRSIAKSAGKLFGKIDKELEDISTKIDEAKRRKMEDTWVNERVDSIPPSSSYAATGSIVSPGISTRTAIGRFVFPDNTAYDVPVRYPFPEKMEVVVPVTPDCTAQSMVGEAARTPTETGQHRYTFYLQQQSAYDGTMRGFYKMVCPDVPAMVGLAK